MSNLIKDFIEKSGSLTKASLLLGTSRRSLGRYRDGEVALPTELREKIESEIVEKEIPTSELIADYIERSGSLTNAALLLGTSRRSLGRYRDGEVELPTELREKMEADHMEKMVSQDIQIPEKLPEVANHVLYFKANGIMPIITIAKSVDYANEKHDFIVVNGADDCVILINPEHVSAVEAEYLSENDPRVEYYKENAMKFNEENVAFLKNNDYNSPSLESDIDEDDIKFLVEDGAFRGSDKEDVSFIVLDPVSSQKYLNLLQENKLENIRKINNDLSI